MYWKSQVLYTWSTDAAGNRLGVIGQSNGGMYGLYQRLPGITAHARIKTMRWDFLALGNTELEMMELASSWFWL